MSEVCVRHRRVLVFGDHASLGEELQQGHVVFGLRLGPGAPQQEAVGPAVELRGLQEARDWRFKVLLLILVTVEGVTQLCRDVLCQRDKTHRRSLLSLWSCGATRQWWKVTKYIYSSIVFKYNL